MSRAGPFILHLDMVAWVTHDVMGKTNRRLILNTEENWIVEEHNLFEDNHILKGKKEKYHGSQRAER